MKNRASLAIRSLAVCLSLVLSNAPAFAYDDVGGCRDRVNADLAKIATTESGLRELESQLSSAKTKKFVKTAVGLTTTGIGALFFLGSAVGGFSDATGAPGANRHDTRNAVVGMLISGAVMAGSIYWIYLSAEQVSQLKSLVAEAKATLASQKADLQQDLAACRD